MAENFLFSRYYDSSADNDKFVVIYNLHLSIVQIVLSTMVGVFKFRLVDFLFEFSPSKLLLWGIIGIVLNVRWLIDFGLGLQVDRADTDRKFGLRFLTVCVAQAAVMGLGLSQHVSWLEWTGYAALCVAAFYIHIFKFETEITIVDIEPSRPSTISLNVKNNSIYIPSNN